MLVHCDNYELLIDGWNYQWLSAYNWSVRLNQSGIPYICRKHNGYYIWMAREILTRKLGRILLPYPQELCDHADRNTLNNQEYNLRVADNRQNRGNCRKRSITTSVYKGVTCVNNRDWYTSFQGKQYYMKTELRAAVWYDVLARASYREFAWLNFPFAEYVGTLAF